jgi:hypothetical protein
MANFGSAAAVLLMAAAGLPPADPMTGRYGNTQKTTHKDGRIMRAMFNADKSVTLMRPDGSVMQGTWAIESGELCLSVSMLVVAMKRCMPFVPDKRPGDSWTQKGPDGEEVTVAIVQGRS